MSSHASLRSSVTGRSWLAETRRRLLRRPRAALERVIRREVRRQVPDTGRLLSSTLADQRLRTRLEESFDEQWELRKSVFEVTPSAANRDFTHDVFFGHGARYDRTLNRSRYSRLATEIAVLTAASGIEDRMQQAYRAILTAETVGLGRIAGSTYNIIGKLVVPPLLDPPAGPVLEIGTLFGLFAPALIRQFRRRGEFRHLSVIDPLEGTQIQPGMAPAGDPTGTPVTAEVARLNFAQCGLGLDDFRIIQGLSTDTEIRAEAGDRRYAVVVIDGDHSEAGVYEDLRWSEQLLLPGGIVVMDDFGDPRWPGVERATDRYRADGGRMELLGVAATSAYLRMPRP